MSSKQVKYQIEVENPNKENKCYQEGHKLYKQRNSRIPLTDITDSLYPKRREEKSSPLKYKQLMISLTIQLR